jgi:hypothetical protein
MAALLGDESLAAEALAPVTAVGTSPAGVRVIRALRRHAPGLPLAIRGRSTGSAGRRCP